MPNIIKPYDKTQYYQTIYLIILGFNKTIQPYSFRIQRS